MKKQANYVIDDDVQQRMKLLAIALGRSTSETVELALRIFLGETEAPAARATSKPAAAPSIPTYDDDGMRYAGWKATGHACIQCKQGIPGISFAPGSSEPIRGFLDPSVTSVIEHGKELHMNNTRIIHKACIEAYAASASETTLARGRHAFVTDGYSDGTCVHTWPDSERCQQTAEHEIHSA